MPKSVYMIPSMDCPAEDAYRAGQTDVTALYFIEQEARATEAKKIELEQQIALAWISLQRAAGSTP